MGAHRAADGPQTARPGDIHIHRGSRKRLKRISWLYDSSPEFWLFLVLFLLLMFVFIPWQMSHSSKQQESATPNNAPSLR
jgi:hypothetical protein